MRLSSSFVYSRLSARCRKPNYSNSLHPFKTRQFQLQFHNFKQFNMANVVKENRLAKEKSPYLLQHKNNPVDWYPWGPEALEKAKKEDKLIFLSVGYSTCHWCHVMERESFENEEIAQVMNDLYVNIKVDREERPDIDKVYMTYVQAISGGGGWPMSVFLTPQLTPVVGGTYFPPKTEHGRIGFKDLLLKVNQEWKRNREGLINQGNEIIAALRKHVEEDASETETLHEDVLHLCFKQLASGYDATYGGFSDQPKFPRPSVFNFIFRYYDRFQNSSASDMSLVTLHQMGKGGMFDHLGGGFHRYSVTRDWLVPHFEKMLYDQAQLVCSYCDAFQISKDNYYKTKATDVLNYVLRVLTSPEGGFYSAEDADSPVAHGSHKKAEGAFYVWTADEITQLLGADNANVIHRYFGVTQKGNVPSQADPHGELRGKNILREYGTVEELANFFGKSKEEIQSIISSSMKILFEAREKRPRPHLDDKIITAWNGLMISAFARGYQTFWDNKYLKAAVDAASFIHTNLYKADQRTLIRNYRDGPSTVEGFADDYSFLIQSLIDLYEASMDIKWMKWAVELQQKQNELFWDKNKGGYFGVKDGDETLLLRMKEDYDGAEPSNNSVSALNLIRLFNILGKKEWNDMASQILQAFARKLQTQPIVLPQMCVALDSFQRHSKQIVIAGKNSSDTHAMLKEVYSHFIPNKVVMFADKAEGQEFLSGHVESIKDYDMINHQATAYVCHNFVCQLPASNPEELKTLL